MLKLDFEKLTFGIARISSGPPSIFIASSVSDDRAVTEIGTSWIDCSRFWAVTMISSTEVAGSFAGAFWAMAGAAMVSARMDTVAAKRA
ncbi:hypothetical protein D3C80_1334740 [compost metagenome]